jgi:hypothetical protein
VKSTPSRGVKQTLQPDAYSQSEPDLLFGAGVGDGVPFV